ncbi:hypothetical protein OPU71_07360 [Niveibacterium sp. 24ML]|uniref:hypothetical protein n=1 Tax=Niveibacterium sp. 24ML TaxID=2985512 RepID=UPI00226E62B2|nr:hypothetical protein [Niveibacterium sp. 24ML]MCX9155943.1 hypothetical protein [Niveibacterium sp. 24ML]
MGYVYEKISSADAEEYGLEAISQEVIVGRLMIENWVIDRERDSYLRKVSEGRPDVDEGITRWTFYWNRKVIWIRRDVLGSSWEGENAIHAKLRIAEMGPLDPDPHQQRSIIEALLNALDVHTTRGGASQYKWRCDYEFAPGILNVEP